MIWSPIVTILAVTVLLCGCGGTISPTAASSMAREPALPEGMEYRSEAPAPETASESLPEITVKPELLTDAGTLCPMEYGTDADVIFFAMMENRSASLLDWLISRHQEDSMPPLRYWRENRLIPRSSGSMTTVWPMQAGPCCISTEKTGRIISWNIHLI